MNLLSILAWVLTLKPLAGYRTYIGAVGLILTGLGLWGAAISDLLAGNGESAGRLFAEGLAAVSAGLAAFGLRQAVELAVAHASEDDCTVVDDDDTVDFSERPTF